MTDVFIMPVLQHFHPPGSPPQPTFRLTPANARSKVSSFRRQNLAKLHGDEMQVVSVPSVVVQPPLAVEPIALGARHAHFDLGAKVSSTHAVNWRWTVHVSLY